MRRVVSGMLLVRLIEQTHEHIQGQFRGGAGELCEFIDVNTENVTSTPDASVWFLIQNISGMCASALGVPEGMTGVNGTAGDDSGS